MKFERRFEGPINIGLRRLIRVHVKGMCGCEAAAYVRTLAGSVAFTAAGKSTLELVASDYASTCKCQGQVKCSHCPSPAAGPHKMSCAIGGKSAGGAVTVSASKD